MALGKVYCFGPTFRAEKSKTRRHLTEFWMVEPEMAYADLDDVMQLAEERCSCDDRAAACSSAAPTELEDARARHRRSSSGRARPFPRITYDEARDDPARRRAGRSSTATTSARPTRRCSSARFDTPGDASPLSARR